MSPWTIAYLLATSLPVAAGTALLARSRRLRGLPERRIWSGGLVLAVALPISLWVLGDRIGPSETSAPAGPVAVFEGLPLPSVEVAPSPTSHSRALLLGWGAGSFGLGLWLALSWLGLRRLRRSSRPITLRGRAVRVSDDLGPAVVGFLRPEIIVPSWIHNLKADEVEWILRHEEEHLRGRDALLLLLAYLSRMLVPWNPAIWLLSHRLLDAVELDCDRRVTRTHPDPSGYAHTLVTAAARRALTRPALGAALVLDTHQLERRIRTMTASTRAFGPRDFALGTLGVLVILSACSVPVPTDAENGLDAPLAEAVVQADPVPAELSFTPFEVQPTLLNANAVIRLMEDEYPPVLRDAGVGGTARVYVYVDEDGEIRNLLLDQASGHPALDEAALRVARQMEFSPARYRGSDVPVWVSLPFAFRVDGEGAPR